MQLNKKGSSVIMALVLLGFIAMTTYIIISQIYNSERRNADRRKQEDLTEMIRSLRLRMDDSVDCSNILKGAIFGLPAAAEKPVILRTAFGADQFNSSNYIKAGKKFINNGITLSKVTINAIKQIPGEMRFDYKNERSSATGPVATRMTKYFAEIRFYPKSFPWNSGAPENTIQIYIKVLNSNKQIWECHSPVSPAETCEVVSKGVYNPWLPLPTLGLSEVQAAKFRCNPDLKCFNIRNKLSADGLFTTPSCPDDNLKNLKYSAFYKATPVAENKYICNWCNRNRP
jgi:hypothetical protein